MIFLGGGEEQDWLFSVMRLIFFFLPTLKVLVLLAPGLSVLTRKLAITKQWWEITAELLWGVHFSNPFFFLNIWSQNDEFLWPVLFGIGVCLWVFLWILQNFLHFGVETTGRGRDRRHAGDWAGDV